MLQKIRRAWLRTLTNWKPYTAKTLIILYLKNLIEVFFLGETDFYYTNYEMFCRVDDVMYCIALIVCLSLWKYVNKIVVFSLLAVIFLQVIYYTLKIDIYFYLFLYKAVFAVGFPWVIYYEKINLCTTTLTKK